MTRVADTAFLFTDIEGSTELWERDPDAMARAVADHDVLLRACVAHAGGTVVKSTGDGVFAAFPTTRDAVAAALAAQDRLESHAWPTAVPLRVRMGVHVGPAERRGDDWFGREVSLAARIADAGHGGYVLLSEPAATMAELRDDVVDLGEHRLRGIDRPQRLLAARLPGSPDRPLRALPVDRTNLPAELDSFVGRECERRELGDLLRAHRVVTVIGPGGAGKTRLATRVAAEQAERMPDGVWFADLRNVHDATGACRAVADAIGLASSPGRPLLDQLADHLRAIRCLLVLDNCEHVVDDTAEVVEALLARANDVQVLATSRVVLDVAGEVVVRLGDLGLPDDVDDPDDVLGSAAARLFIARAAQARPDLTVGPDAAPAIAAVCRLVDGLPLGVELAAAQLRVVDLDHLPVHLTEAGGRLHAGRRRRRGRHGSLDEVVAASYMLLDDEERRLFHCLSVFAGSFSATAVGAVADLSADRVSELLGSLVDQSMVVRVDAPDGARFRLLGTLRRFAARQLDDAGETEVVRDRHLAWTLQVVGDLEAAMRTPRQDVALLQARADHEELRAARAWACERGDQVAALRITASAPVDPEPQRDGVIGELLAAARDVPADLRARSLYTCGASALERGDWQDVRSFAEEAAHLFQAVGDEGQATYARFLAVFGRWGALDDPETGRQMAEVLDRFEAIEDPMGCAYGSWILSQWLLDHEPDDPRIEALATAAIDGFTASEAPFGRYHALEGLAYVHIRRGDGEAGADVVRGALDGFHRDGHVGCASHALDAVAVLLADAGHHGDAAELLGAAVALRTSVGAHLRPWEHHRHAACTTSVRQHLDQASYGAATARGAGLGLDAAVARAHDLLADLADGEPGGL